MEKWYLIGKKAHRQIGGIILCTGLELPNSAKPVSWLTNSNTFHASANIGAEPVKLYLACGLPKSRAKEAICHECQELITLAWLTGSGPPLEDCSD